VVIITRCDAVNPREIADIRQQAAWVNPALMFAEAVHVPMRWLRHGHAAVDATAFRGRACGAFCGLGNPQGFRQTLETLGLAVSAWREFPDHHRYQRADVDDLQGWARTLPADALVVTTQKDMVKLRIDVLGERPCWSLQIALQIRVGAVQLQERLLALVAPK
jgi:tetraacyldisaccharide 4'-kinase